MAEESFSAWVVRESEDGTFSGETEQRNVDDLPGGDVLMRVRYSSLNYKDALSANGNRGVTKRYPHTPGIDAAGTVEQSDHPAWSTGDQVVVTGYDLGMNTPGGLAEYIRVPADWIVRLPEGLTLAESMTIGTAGYTAGYCVMRLEENGARPERGTVLVTGATGGVGCMAVAILAKAGYRVVAATGKGDAADWLLGVGAAEVIGRGDVIPPGDRSLAEGRWAAVVDTVGGEMLDGAIRATTQRGAVACCGMIGGALLSTSIFPFILRGVSLLGVDSAESPMERRLTIWSKLAGDWKPPRLDGMVTECSLGEVGDYLDRMLEGGARGRVRVRIGS